MTNPAVLQALRVFVQHDMDTAVEKSLVGGWGNKQKILTASGKRIWPPDTCFACFRKKWIKGKYTLETPVPGKRDWWMQSFQETEFKRIEGDVSRSVCKGLTL
jgi:hypothetical protein